MKRLFFAALALAACGSNHSNRSVPVTSDLTDSPSCPSDSFISCYPQGSPARRNDLYECKNGGSAHAWVEFMNDKSRLYHVWMRLPGEDLTESFVAEEPAVAAEPFTPIKYGLGQAQSSRVLHGIAEDTREALGLPSTANFLFTLVGGDWPVTMTMAVDNGASLGIPDLRCERVGN